MGLALMATVGIENEAIRLPLTHPVNIRGKNRPGDIKVRIR